MSGCCSRPGTGRAGFPSANVVYFRTLDDYRRLRSLAGGGTRFGVIGGGFIGSEIAAALALNERPVSVVFPEAGIGARIFPAELSAALGRVGGREDVFAAGDVARFPVAALADELRVEHEDHPRSTAAAWART
jgi:pyridine nucleotide-disulfide oxidoreductase